MAGQWERSGELCHLTCADTQGGDRKYSVRYSVLSMLTELQPFCVAGVQHLVVLTVILALKIPTVASLHAKLTVPSLVFRGGLAPGPLKSEMLQSLMSHGCVCV